MKVCNLEFSKFIEAGQHEFSSIDICMYLWTRDPAFKTIFFDGLFQFSLWAKNIKVSFHDDQYHQERVFDEMCWPSRKLFFLMSAYFDRQKPSRKAFFDVLCTSKKTKFRVTMIFNEREKKGECKEVWKIEEKRWDEYIGDWNKQVKKKREMRKCYMLDSAN